MQIKSEGNNVKQSKIILVSRCSWTLLNFRSGLIRKLISKKYKIYSGGALENEYHKDILNLGVPFKILPINKNGVSPLSDLWLLLSLFFWYRREKPDIVHHFTIKPVIFGSIAAFMAGVPKTINTITGLGYVFTNERNGILQYLVEKLYKIAFFCSDYNFFQNKDDLSYFLNRRLVKRKKTEIVPGSGVDCRYFRPSNKIKNTSNGVKFLMVSRILKDKGIFEYVNAAIIVKKRYPSSDFYLLGKRDTRNPSVVPKNILTKWQNEGYIKWLGEVSDVRKTVNDADVVVLPSYREGLPRSLLEAAAMQKPIITTNATGCKDVVEHGYNGLIIPTKDSSALADAMVKMIEDNEMRKEMGINGRLKVLSEFDEKIVINKTINKYN